MTGLIDDLTAGPARPRTARELGIMQGFPPPPEKRPSLENWDLAPFNRWSFQNMRALFPTAEVAAADTPRPLPAAPQDLDAVAFTGFDGARRSLSQHLQESYTDALLVWHRGAVVTERYFNDMGPRVPHLAQSVSKSVVGILAGILHGEGGLDLHAPLGQLVPELAACGYAEATLDQVLDMRSGVRFVEDYGHPHSDMTRIDVASGWRPAPGGGPVPTIRDVILTLPQERPHGGAFSYRSIETDVIAWVLERATGQPLAQLVSDRIWRPMGAEVPAFFTVDAAATALADGGFNAALRDYARFGLLVLEGGARDGRQIIPESWIAASRQGDTAAFGAPYTALSPRGAYARQWWVHDRDRGDIMARGVFGQFIYLDFETQFMMVKLSSWPDYLIDAYSHDTLRAALALRQALAG